MKHKERKLICRVPDLYGADQYYTFYEDGVFEHSNWVFGDGRLGFFSIEEDKEYGVYRFYYRFEIKLDDMNPGDRWMTDMDENGLPSDEDLHIIEHIMFDLELLGEDAD